MKKVLLVLFVFSLTALAQFKEPGFPAATPTDGIYSKSNSSGLFGFLNSENFQMRHSYNMSFSTMGNHSAAVGMYTNSMFYKFSKELNAQMDVSFVHSPYNNLGQAFQNSMNNLYISRAAVNYQPSKDFLISIQYQRLPFNSYYSPYGGYYRNRGYNDFYDSPF